MIYSQKESYWSDLLRELCKLPHEIEYVEFKSNNQNPEEIGKYISSLANAAALNDEAHGYLVWGIDDKTHTSLAQTFSPHRPNIAMNRLNRGYYACSHRKSISNFTK